MGEKHADEYFSVLCKFGREYCSGASPHIGRAVSRSTLPKRFIPSFGGGVYVAETECQHADEYFSALCKFGREYCSGASPQEEIRLNYFGITDVGCVRLSNQDCFRTERMTDPESQKEYLLLVVCDGMGGANGGETASLLACDTFVECIAENSSRPDKSALLTEAVHKANTAVFSAANANKELIGMGTTLCAALIDTADGSIYAVSVGDSRIYLYARHALVQLSHDHSYVQALVDSGAITKDESRVHPNKNIITRAVGTRSSVECDSFLLKLDDIDGLLLCSDGLTGFVSDEDCCECFEENRDAEKIAVRLAEKAKMGGGGDNITAVVLYK